MPNETPTATDAPAGRTMPRPDRSPEIAPRTIQALTSEFRGFDPEQARSEYPWATRFVMGLPLAPWQRDFKWTEAQARAFIVSIWSGLHIGNYVVTDLAVESKDRADPHSGLEYTYLSNCVIDGQQRLKALELYVTDALAVPDAAGELCVWSEVSQPDRRRFENTLFARGTLRELDELVLKSTYDRLNFGGVPHLESERALPLLLPEEEESASRGMRPSS